MFRVQPRNFYPRSPCGERLKVVEPGLVNKLNFYPRSPCGERRFFPTLEGHKTPISIHALLAESDRISEDVSYSIITFLSTLSLRRATIIRQHSEPDRGNFYPRSPCGERPMRIDMGNSTGGFLSTLSLRRATPVVPAELTTLVFLSTLSLRRATY